MTNTPLPTQPTAALAGVPTGIQPTGPWTGRRLAFIRFATEAETAQMYTSTALVRELTRLSSRARLHGIGVNGRDPLGNSEFLLAALRAFEGGLPVLLEGDGQRPDRIPLFAGVPGVAAFQFNVTLAEPDAHLDRALESLQAAAALGVRHALTIAPVPEAPDAVILRAAERVQAAAPGTELVLHPILGERPGSLDRRWATLLEQVTALHLDARLVLRVPPPAGLR